jgi:hypothetical protein
MQSGIFCSMIPATGLRIEPPFNFLPPLSPIFKTEQFGLKYQRISQETDVCAVSSEIFGFEHFAKSNQH